jgi:hypothetical protein
MCHGDWLNHCTTWSVEVRLLVQIAFVDACVRGVPRSGGSGVEGLVYVEGESELEGESESDSGLFGGSGSVCSNLSDGVVGR